MNRLHVAQMEMLSIHLITEICVTHDSSLFTCIRVTAHYSLHQTILKEDIELYIERNLDPSLAPHKDKTPPASLRIQLHN